MEEVGIFDIVKGGLAVAVVGGGGAGIKYATSPEFEEQFSEEDYKDFVDNWNEIVSKSQARKNGLLGKYESKIGNCSREFFPDLAKQGSFKLGQKFKGKIDYINTWGCVDLNIWKGRKGEFLAKMEAVILKGKRGVIVTNIITPHPANKDYLKSTYLRVDITHESDMWQTKWGGGWYYSLNQKNNHKISFYGKWHQKLKNWEGNTVNLWEVCSLYKEALDTGKIACQQLRKEKIDHGLTVIRYNNSWNAPNKLSEINSPLQGYGMSFIGNQYALTNPELWTKGDTHAHTVTSYQLNENGWKHQSKTENIKKLTESLK